MLKKLMPHIAAVFFSLFGAGVIILLMSYTFEALAYIFPDNFTAQLMGMILFDVAAIAWLGAFIYLCKSVMQYAFAFIGFAFGLAGSLGMVAIDVMLGGQKMIEAPAWINEALVYGFIGAAAAHVILFYAYKLSAPEISADISLGIETANITEESMKQAEDLLLRDRRILGATIAPRLIANVKRNLGLPVSGDVIDLPAYDVNDLTQAIPVQMPAQTQTWEPAQMPARKIPFFERLKAAAQVLTNSNPAPHVYHSQPSAPVPSSPTPQADAPIPSSPATDPQPEPQAETPAESEVAGNQPDPLSGGSGQLPDGTK